MYILAIDTSCDDTSVAIVDHHFTVRSNVVSSQVDLHRPYGGVFPTVAKLAHQENIQPCLALALAKAHLSWSDISALAVTIGPGLAPALEIGLKTATQLATEHQLPLIPVNHVEAHAWSCHLQPHHHHQSIVSSGSQVLSTLAFPALALVVSGGHTEFININSPGEYEILGQTLDDAAGECLDKIGRMLNLGYPAGPAIEQLAKKGHPETYSFPLPLTTRHDFDLSFSGLKTYARNLIRQLETDSPQEILSATTIYDLCASSQKAVFRHIIYKLNKLLSTKKSLENQLQSDSQSKNPPFSQIWLGGGVAANIEFRRQLRSFLRKSFPSIKLLTPYHQKFCGDNAAMIALVAQLKYPLATSTQPQLFTTPDLLDRQPNLPITSW